MITAAILLTTEHVRSRNGSGLRFTSAAKQKRDAELQLDVSYRTLRASLSSKDQNCSLDKCETQKSMLTF